MASHSSILARKIPWTEDPGVLQSTGLQRIGHNLVTKEQASLVGASTLRSAPRGSWVGGQLRVVLSCRWHSP